MGKVSEVEMIEVQVVGVQAERSLWQWKDRLVKECGRCAIRTRLVWVGRM